MEQINQFSNNWIDEYHEGARYGLRGKILVNEKSDFQEITIIDSPRYGRGLLLDGCWMTAEKQEKHYHEAIVHPALCSSKNLRRALIIGGGDGGTARECLRHLSLEQLDMIELDRRVVELSKKYLNCIGGSAWEDPRLKLCFEDGIEYVNNLDNDIYDVIIVDGSDAKGPAKGLFNKIFFQNCRRILKSGGVFATQSESPESFQKIHIETIKIIREVFEYADPLYGWVPMYPSGWWSWTFAAIDSPRYLEPIPNRIKAIKDTCHIWSPTWQQGAFQAIPAFVERELNK